MVALTAFALGANGQVIPGRLFRHAVGSAFRASGTGLQVVSGVIAGAPNTMGELTLVSNTQLTVQPFRAVIQNSQDLTAGGYLIPSETVQTFTAGGAAGQAIPAQDASQFRRALVTLHVDDAQVAGSGANDALLEVLPGALAATAGAAALPATPANAVNFGELLIPPTGQTVTLTAYNPRTGIRHGIQPATVVDGLVTAGHDGAPGTHLGQYRDHPTYGLQRWNGTTWKKVPGVPALIAQNENAGGATALTPGMAGFGVSGGVAIPAHSPGTLMVVHLHSFIGPTGTPLAGFTQTGVGPNASSWAPAGARIRFHNNSAVGMWPLGWSTLIDSDGVAKNVGVLGWSDPGSGGTISSIASSIHVWQL